MLSKVQIKSLEKGLHPNSKFYGPNNFYMKETTGLDGKKEKVNTPIYENRRQRRRVLYQGTPRSAKIQRIVDKKAIESATNAGKVVFNGSGELKSRYIRKIVHIHDPRY